MAEGDTIVRTARRLEPELLGRPIIGATAPNPRSPLRRGSTRLVGREVERIETRGKHLLFHLTDGLTLHSHMGMSGSWRIDTGRGFGRSERSAWLILDLGGTWVGQFGGPTLRLVRTVELRRDPRLATLGPDILADGFDPAEVVPRFRSHGGQIGEALMDQRVLCGIGNIFKSESCFENRIDPWRPSGSLAVAEVTGLLETARRQMEVGVETGRRPSRVYRHAGRRCPRCLGATIRSRAQGDDGRLTYWCPGCQL
jgi:endonuclease-8